MDNQGYIWFDVDIQNKISREAELGQDAINFASHRGDPALLLQRTNLKFNYNTILNRILGGKL